MKTRSISFFTILSNAMIFMTAILFFPGPVSAEILDFFTIPESKLLDVEFSSTSWGGTVVTTDAAGEAVLFAFSGLNSSGTGIKDDYPVDTVYGQVLPSHGNGDFSIFDGYVLTFENLDDAPVYCSLFLNTGFTGPSGNPPNNPANDTFWQSSWKQIQPGEKKTLRLEFDHAIPYSISDNPSPHTQGINGQFTAINEYDRAEISSIGFQIYTLSNPEADILISPNHRPQCDLDGNWDVDLADLAYLASRWLMAGCGPDDWCDGCDFDQSTNVGLEDLQVCCDEW